MRDYEITKKIPARKKQEVFTLARKTLDKQECFLFIKSIVQFYGEKESWTSDEKKECALSLYACALAAIAMEKADDVFTYLAAYVNWKTMIFTHLNDYGAIGDAIETCIHLIACRQYWRAKKSVLHVSPVGKHDIVIDGTKYEIAHNGKSWMESTPDNCMSGTFNGVIYGMFSHEDIQTFCDLFHNKQVLEGLQFVSDNMIVFQNKNDYVPFIDGISKGKGIVWKPAINRFQTVFNESKAKAWKRAIDSDLSLTTLTDFFKTLGDNDFID